MTAPRGQWRKQIAAGQVEKAQRAARSNRIACIGFVVLAGIGIYLFAPKWWQVVDFQRHNKTAPCTVFEEYTKNVHTRKGVTFIGYSIRYEFVVDGKPFSGSDTIEDPPSPTMTVHYHELAPGINRIELQNIYVDHGIFFALCLVLLASVIGAWVCTRTIRSAQATAE
ncbi:MAG: hypothetical protein H0W83_00270 [Planctomycetes bacterium]|nr:hypothetical protein [Planctomycetota bacterium]